MGPKLLLHIPCLALLKFYMLWSWFDVHSEVMFEHSKCSASFPTDVIYLPVPLQVVLKLDSKVWGFGYDLKFPIIQVVVSGHRSLQACNLHHVAFLGLNCNCHRFFHLVSL